MGVTLAVSLVGLSLGQSMMNGMDATAQSAKAPSFEVDPFCHNRCQMAGSWGT